MKTSCFSSFFSGSKRGFTLIELLVVISIIALLIGILLPALNQARGAAQTAACMANSRSNGQGILQYSNENHNLFPDAYHYRNASNDFYGTAIGGGGANGYYQWTGALEKGGFFNTDSKGWVCPAHAVGGWAPSNFTAEADGVAPSTRTGGAPDSKVVKNTVVGTAFGKTGNGLVDPAGNLQISQSTTTVDNQAVRLSYSPNEALMPRLRGAALYEQAGGTKYVKTDAPTKNSGTILLAEYSDYTFPVNGSSASGTFFKSHRPTNGVRNWDNSVMDGEAGGTPLATNTDGNATSSKAASPGKNLASASFWAIDPTTILTDASKGFASVDPTKGGTSNENEHAHHFVYQSAGRHSGGFSGGGVSNYTYADGHAQSKKVVETVDPNDYQWGLKFWSSTLEIPVTQDAGTSGTAGTVPVN